MFTDVMHEESMAVYESKKAALMKGEEAVVQQIGKGKDILSILRKSMRRETLRAREDLPKLPSIVKANMVSNEEDRLPEEEVVGQIKCVC